jgi:DMSO/TMAO reductase YedYZ molybdopterin-dependent catalytic subunit
MISVLVVFLFVSVYVYGTYGQTKSSIPSMEQSLINISYNELIAMPRTTINAELDCVGSYVASGNWTGVQLGYLLEKAGLTQKANTVELYASDGYSTHISYSLATRGDVIVAYELDGKALLEVTRLVIPDTNGDIWISNITRIKVIYDSGDYSSIILN